MTDSVLETLKPRYPIHVHRELVRPDTYDPLRAWDS
jgi:hypothetical protein